MTLNRRSFLKTCLALAAAPAVCRAESLMKLWVPRQELIMPVQELASAEFYALQIEAEWRGGRYIASAWVKTGKEWVRKSISGMVEGPPAMSINAKGDVELVGATQCVTVSSPMGVGFEPAAVGIYDGLVLTGDAKYSAQGRDAYPGYIMTSAIDAHPQHKPSPSRLVRNLLANTTGLGSSWDVK